MGFPFDIDVPAELTQHKTKKTEKLDLKQR